MSTTTHNHTLIVQQDGCHHDVCVECEPLALRTRNTIDKPRVHFTYHHRPLPVVGQMLRLTDSRDVVHLGHVTSVLSETREWHAHVKPEQPEVVDPEWLATSREERAAVAHLRGWAHHGPTCPICMAGRA